MPEMVEPGRSKTATKPSDPSVNEMFKNTVETTPGGTPASPGNPPSVTTLAGPSDSGEGQAFRAMNLYRGGNGDISILKGANAQDDGVGNGKSTESATLALAKPGDVGGGEENDRRSGCAPCESAATNTRGLRGKKEGMERGEHAGRERELERRRKVREELDYLVKRGESPFQRSEKAMRRSPIEETKARTPVEMTAGEWVTSVGKLKEITCTPITAANREIGSAPEHNNGTPMGHKRDDKDITRRSSIAGVGGEKKCPSHSVTKETGLCRAEPRLLFPMESPDLERLRGSPRPGRTRMG